MSGQPARTRPPTIAATNTDSQYACPECPSCGDTHERSEYYSSSEGTATVLRCPGCGRSFQPIDPMTVRTDLFGALARYRNSEYADVMAVALVRYQQGTRELVGLTAECERGLYLATDAGVLRSVAFDKHGIQSADDTLCARTHDAGAWIDKYGGDLLWTHPRYQRW